MGALSHIRVLDLTRVLAGPWCAQTLADFGADVIKIERPEVGDDTRHWGPPYLKTPEGTDTREAAYYLAANRNKRSVTVDIASPEGQQIIRELAAQSDVVLENYKVGQLKKYGLDYASLKEVKPDLIYCSVTGFGQTGPYAQRAGYDFIVQGIGGFMSITGERDGQPGGGPQKAGVAIADLMTGMYSTIAVLTALTHRDRTGEGQYIDMALLDVQVAMLANMNSNYLASGQPPVRWGNAHPNIVPYQTFQTSDGWIIVAVGNDGQFRKFVEVGGQPELADDERFATNPARVRHRGHSRADPRRDGPPARQAAMDRRARSGGRTVRADQRSGRGVRERAGGGTRNAGRSAASVGRHGQAGTQSDQHDRHPARSADSPAHARRAHREHFARRARLRRRGGRGVAGEVGDLRYVLLRRDGGHGGEAVRGAGGSDAIAWPRAHGHEPLGS